MSFVNIATKSVVEWAIRTLELISTIPGIQQASGGKFRGNTALLLDDE